MAQCWGGWHSGGIKGHGTGSEWHGGGIKWHGIGSEWPGESAEQLSG